MAVASAPVTIIETPVAGHTVAVGATTTGSFVTGETNLNGDVLGHGDVLSITYVLDEDSDGVAATNWAPNTNRLLRNANGPPPRCRGKIPRAYAQDWLLYHKEDTLAA